MHLSSLFNALKRTSMHMEHVIRSHSQAFFTEKNIPGKKSRAVMNGTYSGYKQSLQCQTWRMDESCHNGTAQAVLMRKMTPKVRNFKRYWFPIISTGSRVHLHPQAQWHHHATNTLPLAQWQPLIASIVTRLIRWHGWHLHSILLFNWKSSILT